MTIPKVKIKFEATATIEQSIIILSGDTQDEFIKRLQDGRYVTSISFDYNQQDKSVVVDIETLNDVGIIVRGDNVDEHTPYSDFALSED